jgi:hypothetical protein
MTKVERFQHLCKTDLKFLTTKVCGLTRWNDDLHGGLAQVLDAPGDRKLILLPRGHQKSTVISVVWVLQQILRDPDETVAIYSASWPLAQDILHQIKMILETNQALIDAFGLFKRRDTRWTSTFIDIAQKNPAKAKNPTIRTGGIEAGKTGTHCGLMIFDDVVTPENTTTSEMVQKTVSSYQDCLPLLDPGGRVVTIGTRYVPADLYGFLIENEARTINGHALESEEDRAQWRKFVNA